MFTVGELYEKYFINFQRAVRGLHVRDCVRAADPGAVLREGKHLRQRVLLRVVAGAAAALRGLPHEDRAHHQLRQDLGRRDHV